MEAIWLLVAVVVIVAVLQVGFTIAARRQVSVLVNASPQEAADAVLTHFKSVWWRQVNGRGDFSFQARGFGMASWGLENPVLSITIEVEDDGSTEVAVWMSEWASRVGIIGAADRAYLKRRSLVKKLAALDTVNV